MREEQALMQLALRAPVYFLERRLEVEAMYSAVHLAAAWSTSLATAFLAPRALVNIAPSPSAPSASSAQKNIQVAVVFFAHHRDVSMITLFAA